MSCAAVYGGGSTEAGVPAMEPPESRDETPVRVGRLAGITLALSLVGIRPMP